MKKYIRNTAVGLVLFIAMMMSAPAHAISLWVGESYTWDFSGSVLGSTYNMSVNTSGGNLSVTGSGFYRTIKPTQYFSGTATVTAEWDYALYYGGPMTHQRVSVSITCRENPVSISPTSVTLSPGQTYQLSYRHAYDNQYVGAANAYFSGGNSSFTVSSSGLITAKAPGTGYATVYSKVSSASNAPSCYVTVKEVEPTGATIGNYSLLADQTIDIKANVSPSNASVKSTQWHIKSGSDIVSISGGRLTGLKPGSATIYCMINGSIRSNDATVTVAEPKLTISKKTPEDGSTGISVFANPSVTYSHTVSKGDDFNAIALKTNGTSVEGVAELSGNIVRFLPTKPLQELTKYTLSIPRTAVKNKWGSPAQTDATISFTTGEKEQVSLDFSPVSGSYIMKDDAVKISANPNDAKVYYTLDGSNPTLGSALYTDPIKVPYDLTIKAFAVREGYKDSEIVTANFLKSQSEIEEYYPADNAPLFNYSYANPFLRLSGAVVKSNNFRRISLKKSSGEDVAGKAYLDNHIIVFVPDAPLENSTSYAFDIPYDAIKTVNGEVFKGYNWTFTTPTMPVQVSMQGDETVFMLSEDGKLMSRGMQIKSSKATGDFTYEDWNALASHSNGITGISSGYSHFGVIANNNSVKFNGLNYCGELGENNFSHSSAIKSVKTGFQTSALICEDNTLWMCGRNDFHQLIANEGTHSSKFIQVAENVIDVALGNGYTLYVDTDNALWGIGRNHAGQLGDGSKTDRATPVKIMEGVEKVFASSSGYFSACITTGGELYTWGDNSQSQLGRSTEKNDSPIRILTDIADVALGGAHGLALTDDYKLYCWGSNVYGQIGVDDKTVSTPKLMDKGVMDIDAGPKTSLVLYINGKVSGWGNKSHSNFGNGLGVANNLTVNEGYVSSPLQGVSLIPERFEIESQSEFAFSPVPKPLNADYDYVEWSSDDPEIAMVDGNGIVVAGKQGETAISAKFVDRYGNSVESKATVVVTNNPQNSGVSGIAQSEGEWTATSVGKNIVIRNASVGSMFTIYNAQGIVVMQSESTASDLSFEVYNSGVYIVMSGQTVRKVLCK